MKNEIFDLKRFWLVLKRDIYINQKPVLIGLSILFFLYLTKVVFIWLGKGYISAQTDFENFFINGYIIVGIVISGLAFGDFRSKETSMSYLMLPASTLEKALSMILLTTIGYTLLYIIVFVVFNTVAVLGGLVFDVKIGFYNMFNTRFLHTIGGYLIINSILLTGAATFRRSPLIKTILIIFGVFWAAVIILSIIAGFIFHNIVNFDFLQNMAFYNGEKDLTFLKTIGKILLWITPPVFWSVTYFKIKEKQV